MNETEQSTKDLAASNRNGNYNWAEGKESRDILHRSKNSTSGANNRDCCNALLDSEFDDCSGHLSNNMKTDSGCNNDSVDFLKADRLVRMYGQGSITMD